MFKVLLKACPRLNEVLIVLKKMLLEKQTLKDESKYDVSMILVQLNKESRRNRNLWDGIRGLPPDNLNLGNNNNNQIKSKDLLWNCVLVEEGVTM